jgi:hypothetical protein
MPASVGSDWIIIIGHRVAKRSLWVFGFVFVLCVSVVMGLLYLVLRDASLQSAEMSQIDIWSVPPGALAEPEDSAVVEFKNPIKALLARHIAATRYNEIACMSVSGEYQVSGMTCRLRIMARAPSRYKMVLEYDGLKVEIGCVDHEQWVDPPEALAGEDGQTSSEENRVFIFMELPISFLGWQDLSNLELTDFDLLPDQEWHGRSVSVLRSRAFDVPILHYLDQGTWLEVRRSANVTSKDGVEHLLEVVFDPPQEGLRFPLPSGYTCFVDGVQFTSAKFIEYEFDEWLPSVLFKRPETAWTKDK